MKMHDSLGEGLTLNLEAQKIDKSNEKTYKKSKNSSLNKNNASVLSHTSSSSTEMSTRSPSPQPPPPSSSTHQNYQNATIDPNFSGADYYHMKSKESTKLHQSSLLFYPYQHNSASHSTQSTHNLQSQQFHQQPFYNSMNESTPPTSSYDYTAGHNPSYLSMNGTPFCSNQIAYVNTNEGSQAVASNTNNAYMMNEWYLQYQNQPNSTTPTEVANNNPGLSSSANNSNLFASFYSSHSRTPIMNYT